MSTGVAGLPVLVTRPSGDAQDWVLKLKQGGFNAEALPLIDIAPAADLEDVSVLERTWAGLDRYAACLFVSGNAVKHFFRKKVPAGDDLYGEYAINSVAMTPDNVQVSLRGLELAPHLRFMAPGPGTSAALVAHGVPLGRIDAPPPDADQFDSEALWQLVGQRDWKGRRVLIVRGTTGGAGEGAGSSGREWMARQWQLAGAEVDFVSVYKRLATQLTQAQLVRARTASADGSIWLFSSSEALANLTAQSGLHDVDWSRARAVATHPRIMAAVRSAGWGVVVASRPAFKDILNTLVSIESGSHE